ncbi:MAG: histidine kinase [Clostridia bacterium]|nr:histidine kinase [Clostridia bacterium]
MIKKTGKLSLKKSAFIRLVIITFGAVLIFYAIGLNINNAGIQNVRNDLQLALETHTNYIAEQLDQDFNRLQFFMLELMSDKDLMRYALSNSFLDDYQRLVYIKSLSGQEYMIKRSSDLAESVQIMLPEQQKTISTDPALYVDLDHTQWNELLARAERNRVTYTVWSDRLWMLLPRYEGNRPLFMIVISVSPDSIENRLSQMRNESVDKLILLRDNGTVFALSSENRLSADTSLESNTGFTSETQLQRIDMTLRGYSRINEMMTPFVTYRRNLWTLTLIAFGLMLCYLLYYEYSILRPVNDIFDTMRKAGENGNFHIETTRKSDYDDIYAQYNEMVEHIEQLAGRVYEEQYRAQKAELKQLQMQIDPHFLYNTLYLIYRVAQSDGNKTIAALSLNLSNYYRYITKMPEQIVALRDEIRHVTNYLEIQRIRFEPRIHIDIEPLPEEIAGERIPSLIIQPIVENAFQHGVKDCIRDGLVTLRYQVSEQSFSVILSDNSGKMDDSSVHQLWKQIQDTHSSDSNALRNLYRRLQLYESDDHALTLKCVNHGLTAILTFQRRGTTNAVSPDCR